NPDGTAIVPSKLAQTSELATVSRDSLAFEVSRWAQGNALVNPAVGDPYVEAARQIMMAAERQMDARIIPAAGNTPLLKDVYSTTTPRLLDWDLCVDSKVLWGDEQDSVVGMCVHSQVHKDLLKLKDSTGRPLLLRADMDSEQTFGAPIDAFCNVPV